MNSAMGTSTSVSPSFLLFRFWSPSRTIDGDLPSALEQCAAVRTNRSEIREPPHLNSMEPSSARHPIAAMWGYSPFLVFTPPTINGVVDWHFEMESECGFVVPSANGFTKIFSLVSSPYSSHSKIENVRKLYSDSVFVRKSLKVRSVPIGWQNFENFETGTTQKSRLLKALKQKSYSERWFAFYLRLSLLADVEFEHRRLQDNTRSAVRLDKRKPSGGRQHCTLRGLSGSSGRCCKCRDCCRIYECTSRLLNVNKKELLGIAACRLLIFFFFVHKFKLSARQWRHGKTCCVLE